MRDVRRRPYVDRVKLGNKASRAGRGSFQAMCAWMRPRSGTGERQGWRVPHTRPPGRIPGHRGPCSTFRRVARPGRNPEGRGAEQWPSAIARPLGQGEDAVAKRPRRGAFCCRSPLQYRHIAAGDPPKTASHIASVAHVPIYEIGSSKINVNREPAMKAILLACIGCALTFPAAAADTAAGYPSRPIRLIIANTTGTSVDTLSRVLAVKFGEELGQQVVADNRAGAGGTIGAEIASQSAPDGHTLLISSTGMQVIAPQIYAKLNYHPVKDFEAISLFAVTQNILV